MTEHMKERRTMTYLLRRLLPTPRTELRLDLNTSDVYWLPQPCKEPWTAEEERLATQSELDALRAQMSV
ncbi:hypothetical protein EH165_01110 [Nakamurella antarctica]|uniref:Uncharacterized protein n=1 Tax=Nakamurella antarctica TaxID=1902245 RepID=A0A3G8ZHW6_9ACTN|nr:hypothetical protein [Nakamurella antarctica]AZI56972.1 hypothetical protein EH165_01110 [Nakamurella antarctica]